MNCGKREKRWNWKGGMRKSSGYILFKIPEGHKYSCMKRKDGYVLLHRLIMAQHLGRPLKPEEVVHHINGDGNDNRIENMKLYDSGSQHASGHGRGLCKDQKKYDKRYYLKNRTKRLKQSKKWYWERGKKK